MIFGERAGWVVCFDVSKSESSFESLPWLSDYKEELIDINMDTFICILMRHHSYVYYTYIQDKNVQGSQNISYYFDNSIDIIC